MNLDRQIYASNYYCPCDDLWLITCYFNPSKYQTKLINYKKFEHVISESKLNLLTIECAFNNDAFELVPTPNVLQIRTQNIMWQKERLLNIAINHLPPIARKVAWVDCDILFSNPNWAVETSSLLDIYPVVQPYQTVVRLPKDQMCYQGYGTIWNGFGYMLQKNPKILSTGNFHLHGHTGMIWAARVELLKTHGLYDACISGSGDHLMAHAMHGNFNCLCIERIVGPIKIKNKFFRHFLKWAYPFYLDVLGKVGFVSGEVLHLWHGEIENRKYTQRHQELRELGFDPFNDLQHSNNGTWVWGSHSNYLFQEWAENYFCQRQEDGMEPSLKP